MPGFSEDLFIFVLQLNVFINLLLDHVVFICEHSLQLINSILFVIQVSTNTIILLLIFLQPLLQDSCFILQFTNVGLYLPYLRVYFRNIAFVAAARRFDSPEL